MVAKQAVKVAFGVRFFAAMNTAGADGTECLDCIADWNIRGATSAIAFLGEQGIGQITKLGGQPIG